MIKIEIETSDLRVMEGISPKTQKPYNLRIQTGYAFTVGPDGKPSKYPEKFEFMLGKEELPYNPGIYQLHPSAVSVDRDGKLSIAPRLTPVKSQG